MRESFGKILEKKRLFFLTTLSMVSRGRDRSTKIILDRCYSAFNPTTVSFLDAEPIYNQSLPYILQLSVCMLVR